MGPVNGGTVDLVKEISSSLTVDFILVAIILALSFVIIHLYRTNCRDRAAHEKKLSALIEKYTEEIRELNARHDLDMKEVTSEAIKGLEATNKGLEALSREINVDEKIASIRSWVESFKRSG